MEFEDAEPSTQEGKKDGREKEVSMDDYSVLIMQMRKANLLLQQVCQVPLGELTMLLTLSCLSEGTGAVPASSLDKAMNLSRPAVSRMLHVLEKKGCLEMKNDEDDQRYVLVYPTEKGLKILQEELSYGYHLLKRVSDRMGVEHTRDFLHYSAEFYQIMTEEISKREKQ